MVQNNHCLRNLPAGFSRSGRCSQSLKGLFARTAGIAATRGEWLQSALSAEICMVQQSNPAPTVLAIKNGPEPAIEHLS
jgi:hypothetical protein